MLDFVAFMSRQYSPKKKGGKIQKKPRKMMGKEKEKSSCGDGGSAYVKMCEANLGLQSTMAIRRSYTILIVCV